ncbi:hypothetical protein LQK89_17475 (plasmid) [Curtobacterium sp. C1]|uniref:hypothetical protein n=1 Tax=Curtobacterium sp. C1 TaxID=2898151 RepID=UPI001E377E14|nr:hypothetical protein [Curtobacterium sp. C1]UFU15902.1 hypothetical protein LQK89_17180 [Curtobacterium sp. C1]UFU16011.1 hypothetical protein LQK89_17475 [Curtobacterium sp. C1]
MGIIGTRRYCDWCWRNLPETRRECNRCTRLDHLGRGALCRSCRAQDRITQTFNDDVLRRQPALGALRDHLLNADPGYFLRLVHSGRAWRRLCEIAAHPVPITHDDLDRFGTRAAMSQVRSLLVDLGVLPYRDERLVELERWTQGEIQKLTGRANELAITQFTRWRQQRRRRDTPMTATILANDKREVRLVVALLCAIERAHHDIRTVPQAILDRWLASQSRDATRVRHFIRWCVSAGINPSLVVPGYARPDFLLGGTHGASNEAALTAAATDQILDPRHRLAIILAVVYGIRVHRIAALPISALQLGDDDASIRLGTIDLRLPDIARPWVEAIRSGITVKRRLGGRDTDPVWIFPGYRHGDHTLPSSLAAQLRQLGVDPTVGHRAAAGAVVTQVPSAVVARVLGVSIATASTWARLAGIQPGGPVSREFG